MTAPEAMSFRAAWQTLRDEVSAFLDLIPLSNPEQLAEMAAQVGKFEKKLEQLPRIGELRAQPRKQTIPVEQSAEEVYDYFPYPS